MITQIDKDTFETVYRGRIYTLCRSCSYAWSMWNKTINGRTNPPKPFDSLADVEKHYKHWKGIALLAGEK